MFNQGGLITSITEDIMPRLWVKLFINVGINALTATLGCLNGDLLHLPGIRSRMETAVAEAVTVAKAQDILIQDDPFAATVRVCEKTAKNISSMLQDVRQQRRTEIDAINGAVLKRGLDLGIATPENLRLVDQVKKIEKGYLRAPEGGLR
jgi:2-dehydropantoate 2-reductase